MLFEKGELYKIIYPMVFNRWPRKYVIFSPSEDYYYGINSYIDHLIPFMFCIGLDGKVRFPIDGEKNCVGYRNACKIEPLNTQDYEEIRLLLTNSRIVYNRKLKMVVEC